MILLGAELISRFRVPEVFIGAFLAIAVFAMGFLATNTPSRHIDYQREASQAIGGKNKVHGFWEKTADDPIAYFTLWLVTFTGVLAVSTVGLWIVTWRSALNQSREMRASLAISKAASDAAQKSADAAMGAALPNFIVLNISTRVINQSLDATLLHEALNIHLKNLGETPAVVERQCIAFAADKELPAAPTYPVENTRDVGFGAAVLSGETYDIWIPNPWAKEQIQAYMRMEAKLWVYGFIEYRDFLGNAHRKGFCASLRAMTRLSLIESSFLLFSQDGPENYTYTKRTSGRLSV